MRTKPIMYGCVAGVLVLAVSAACRDASVASMEGESSRWLTVLAEEALASHQRLNGVWERPVVNVATSKDLEHYTDDLSLVHGVVDRDTRPQYVLREDILSEWWVREHLAETGRTMPPTPVEEPPPIAYGVWSLGGIPFEAEIFHGPWTLSLDRVEVDTETRKVAVFSVWTRTVPFVNVFGKIQRTPFIPGIQYRIEGTWDGRWVAGVMQSGHPLPEYAFPTPPELHIPDFVFPKEAVR